MAKIVAAAEVPGVGTVMIEYGMRGYYAINTRLTAQMLNESLGVSPEVSEAFVAGSMFGWNVPAAKAAQSYRDSIVQARKFAERRSCSRS